MDSVGRFLTFGKDEAKKREKFRKKKEKKHHRHQNPSLISTHITKRGTRTRSLSPPVSRKNRSVSFPRFLDARKRLVFLAFFFARATTHTARASDGSITRAKRTKKNAIIASKARKKIIAPTGTRATRLADSTRAKRAERMRSNPFFLSFGFETVSMYGWVPASVEASSS